MTRGLCDALHELVMSDWTCEQETLSKITAECTKRCALSAVFDPLRHRPELERVGKRDDGARERPRTDGAGHRS